LFTPKGLFGHSAVHGIELFLFDPQQGPQIMPPRAGQFRLPLLYLQDIQIILLMF
jgi:hypothetical protein